MHSIAVERKRKKCLSVTTNVEISIGSDGMIGNRLRLSINKPTQLAPQIETALHRVWDNSDIGKRKMKRVDCTYPVPYIQTIHVQTNS